MTDVQIETNALASGFTLRFLNWRPWLPRAEDTNIPEERKQLVRDAIGDRPNSDYVAVLANDFEAWRARDTVHHHVYGGETPEAAARRELAATTASRINGCKFCASVHARMYVANSGPRDVILRFLEDGLDADLPAADRAVVDAAAKLTTDPEQLTATDLKPLQDIGLDPIEILDALNYAAFFANANRLMLSLGAPDNE